MTASNQRVAARYTSLRALGYSFSESRSGSQTIALFCEMVSVRGRDPAEYGSLSRHHGKGGWPKRETTCRGEAAAKARYDRYHDLRALGASAFQASEGCGCEAGFLRIKRELCGVFKKSTSLA